MSVYNYKSSFQFYSIEQAAVSFTVGRRGIQFYLITNSVHSFCFLILYKNCRREEGSSGFVFGGDVCTLKSCQVPESAVLLGLWSMCVQLAISKSWLQPLCRQLDPLIHALCISF